MLQLMAGLAAMLLVAGTAFSGELDQEFAGKKTSTTANPAKATPAPSAEKVKTSEMDDESPEQANRGWRGGWGGRYWGGYRGYAGFYRPWSYGYGWGRWYRGGPYVSLNFGYPYAYYPAYYYANPYYYSYYF